MHYFIYHAGELYCEEVPVKKIVEKCGTPLYIYSGKTIRRHFKVFDSVFSEIEHLTCYSVKANSNIGVLALLAREGSGADIVSGGELYRALKAGIPPQKIVFSGVGKTPAEMEAALKAGILMFNVESLEELEVLGEVAKTLKIKAPFAIRANPNVDPKTHPYISTGLSKNKFGIPEEEVIPAYLKAKENPYLLPLGLDAHIGSQLTTISPFIDALRRLKALWEEISSFGFELKYFDIGGGLGIVYDQEEPPLPEEYSSAILKELKGLPITLLLEPGRLIVGNAGILVTKVLYTKANREKKFVIVDAAMNDLIRPALYQAYHKIVPVEEKEGEEVVVDIVGPICESGDFLAKERKIPQVKRGDLLAVMSAGAYGFVMSSNYNSRPRAAEVLVEGDQFFLVRQRETVEDLISLEAIPPLYL
ncbi:diaminopimelate decarboxylase [Caldimicrobium thiodismutans]|uniref:Diaminopimelate decarboxylase n=1 Tax=Caldimicrobium thiodismutans TaxID=1653476 RepID=A0A0U4W452_9BACT|nr:diaminopimelate decarboxylase [Caldimicrobium thiodismutans]BAU23882.1 diaminopimelate decarboxylase [Caldimicrobium thiodismutans]